ncbi:catabolic L-serine/threonine dehydratase [Zalaria obscura]|uniref:Catabolic L-serine/threonine dehydratase n=1 Tax=Zalaria obscura TaxID=2024903 RepID=A0ACC3SLK0_9PEZI
MPEPSKTWIKTPLIESSTLSKAAGCRIFLKLENLQPSGSFKSRGIGHYLEHHLRSLTQTATQAQSQPPPPPHFYSSSGGNAGLACVHAARTLDHLCTVVCPTSTKPLMLAKIRAAGAREVLVHGASWAEADRWMREVVMVRAAAGDGERVNGKGGQRETPVYVPPFDHPVVWEGNSTLVGEVGAQFAEIGEEGGPDVLVCSVGGGGLLNGLIDGIERAGWDSTGTQVLALETQGAHSLAASLADGKHVTLPGITSIATSLGATRVSERTYELATTRPWIKSAVLSDAEAAMGCWRLADDERMMVEPACGVNVALCYGGRLSKALGRTVGRDEKVVIVLCGGSNVTVEMLAEWKSGVGVLGDGVSEGEREVVASAATAAATNGVEV